MGSDGLVKNNNAPTYTQFTTGARIGLESCPQIIWTRKKDPMMVVDNWHIRDFDGLRNAMGKTAHPHVFIVFFIFRKELTSFEGQ